MQAAQRHPAAQMIFVVRVTSRAPQRTLARDLNGKRRPFTAQNLSPGFEYVRGFQSSGTRLIPSEVSPNCHREGRTFTDGFVHSPAVAGQARGLRFLSK